MIDCSRFGFALVPMGTIFFRVMGDTLLARYSNGSSGALQSLQSIQFTIPSFSRKYSDTNVSVSKTVQLGVQNVVVVIAECGVILPSAEREMNPYLASYDPYRETVYWRLLSTGSLTVRINTSSSYTFNSYYAIALYHADD